MTKKLLSVGLLTLCMYGMASTDLQSSENLNSENPKAPVRPLTPFSESYTETPQKDVLTFINKERHYWTKFDEK